MRHLQLTLIAAVTISILTFFQQPAAARGVRYISTDSGWNQTTFSSTGFTLTSSTLAMTISYQTQQRSPHYCPPPPPPRYPSQPMELVPPMFAAPVYYRPHRPYRRHRRFRRHWRRHAMRPYW